MRSICRASILSAAGLGLCVSLMACSSPPSQGAAQAPPAAQPAAAQTTAQPPAPAQPKEYELKGKIVAIDKGNKALSVDGEDIPGFMGPMTMSYPVKDEQFLTAVAPGDQITAKIISNGSEYWLEGVTVVGKK